MHAPQHEPLKQPGKHAPAQRAFVAGVLPLLHAMAGTPSALYLALAAGLQLPDMPL